MQLQFLAPVELFFPVERLQFLTRAELLLFIYAVFPAVRFVMSTLLSRMERSTIVECQRIRTNENETDMYMNMHMFNLKYIFKYILNIFFM